MKVVVIEDHPADRKLVRVVLQTSGYVVHDQAAAEGAVESILEHEPDIIVLDLRLPGMDGVALVRQLRQLEATREIPIVAITAYQDSYPRRALLEAGCAAYIAKPIDTRGLPRQLAELAAKRSE